MVRTKSFLATLILITVATPVFADDASLPIGATQGAKIPSQAIAEPNDGPSPYQLKLQYTGEAWDNAAGGLHTGTAYLQNADAQLAVDTGKAFGWTGGSVFLEGFYNSSRSLDTQYVGAAQDPSVIDTSGETMFRLYEAFYKQQLNDTNLLLGIYDLQTEFGNSKPMDIFFNGAYAWNTALDQSGQQGLNGPSSYPNTAPAFRVRQKIDDQWSVQAAVLDGMADSAKNPGVNDVLFNKRYGALAIGEVDYVPVPRSKLMAGYWTYTGKFDTQNETNTDGSVHQVYGSNGGYLGGATRLYTLEGKRGLDGFANLGFADPVVNQVDRSLNAGLNFTGLFDARPIDKFGVAIGIAGAGDAYRKAQIAQGLGVYNYETNFELTYRAPVTEWLTIQPDIQYWIHPNMSPSLKNDLLFGVHFEIGHLFDL